MVFVITVINRILKIIACIILFSFYSFAQEKEVIWENSLEPTIPFTVSIFGTNQGLIQNQIDDILVKESNSILMSTANGIVEFNGLSFKNILKYKKYRDGTFRKLVYCKKRNSLFAIDNVNMLYEVSPRFHQINLNSESVYAITLSGDSLISICESGNIYLTHILTKKNSWIRKLQLGKPLKNVQYKNSMVFQFPFLYVITKNGLLKLNVLNGREVIVLKNEFTRLAVNPFNNNIYAFNLHRLFKITPSVYEIKLKGEFIFEDITFKNRTSFYVATPSGLIYFNNGQQFFNNNSSVLTTTRFHSCYYDTVFNNLYLGSIDKGLLKLTFKDMNTLYNGNEMNESSISSIIKTKSGNVLFAQIVNNIMQIKNSKITLFKNMRLNISSLATFDNLVYVGSWGYGLIVLDDTTEIANIKFPSLLSNDVHAVFKDSKNRFWVGSEGALIKSCKKMQDIQKALPIEFERVQKAYIVNMHYVDTVCLKTNTINMKFDCSIKIGIAHKKNITKYMKIS